MKRLFISSILFFGFTNIVISQIEKPVIALVNPGSFYLKSINQLVKTGIIDTAKVSFEAVFYSKCEVKPEEANQFMIENNVNYIPVSQIDGNLSMENIYKENDCSLKFREVFNNTSGIIFFGGWDIPPYYYGQKTKLTTEIKTPNRHLFELSFLFHLLGGNQNTDFKNLLEEKRNYMVLGICLGMQTMNVATGGDMYQDIPSDIYGIKYMEDIVERDFDFMHKNYNYNLYGDSEINNHSFHKIKFTSLCNLNNIHLDENWEPVVVSSHHQAVKNIGKGLIIGATSMDGKVVEMLIHRKYRNVTGVQFHPEFYTLYDAGSDKKIMFPEDEEPKSENERLIEADSYIFHFMFWKRLFMFII